MIRPLEIIGRFMGRSRIERRLLVTVAFLFASAHVLLRFASLQRTRSRLRSMAARLGAVASDVQQLAWCTDRVADVLPGRHACLVNALVGDAVASASSIPVQFRLGAARSQHGHQFHAWVEHHGTPIIGHEHADFVPFADL